MHVYGVRSHLLPQPKLTPQGRKVRRHNGLHRSELITVL